MKLPRAGWLPIVLLPFCLSGSCGFMEDLFGSSEEEEELLYTLSGALYQSGAAGHTAYLKLVAAGSDSAAPAIYFTSALFYTDVASYLFKVRAGSYTGYAFIDMNDDAVGDATSLPNSGDYAVGSPAVSTMSFPGDRTGDITSWDLIP